MDPASRRRSTLVQSKKDLKTDKNYKIKKGKCSKKTETQDFFTDFKKKRRSLIDKGLEKITTSKLTVRSKTLNYAVRSVFAKKEKVSTLEEDSQALIDEDLFKIIDLSNSNKQKTKHSNFPAKIQPINEFSQNKSIFHEIEEKFQQLGPIVDNGAEPYLISDKDLQNLVQKKIDNQKILNFWETSFQNFCFNRNFSNIFAKIIKNQNLINETVSLYEIKTKFNKTPVSETFVKRRFRKRCNKLTNLQNLDGKLIMATESKVLIDKISQNVISTPKKRFSQLSYRTPENQKISVKDFDFCTKFTPAIRTSDKKYIELNKDLLSHPKFGYNFNISETQKNFFLSEVVNAEKMETLNINNVFERPKKPKTGCKKRRFSFESPLATSPKIFTPNRRLDFSEIINDDFEFGLLDKKNSPPNFGQGRTTPKRGLESMLSPTELELRKKAGEGSKSKKFAAGEIPKKRNTPLFKYGPNFFN